MFLCKIRATASLGESVKDGAWEISRQCKDPETAACQAQMFFDIEEGLPKNRLVCNTSSRYLPFLRL